MTIDRSQSTNGFTLIELMIVVAIIGILAAIAYPSYRDSVLKSRRADVKAELLRMATAQEKFFSRSAGYARTIKSLGYPAGNPENRLDFNEYYTIEIENTPDSGQAASYTVSATAKGSQTEDRCDGLSLDSIGSKGVSEGDNATCWDR